MAALVPIVVTLATDASAFAALLTTLHFHNLSYATGEKFAFDDLVTAAAAQGIHFDPAQRRYVVADAQSAR